MVGLTLLTAAFTFVLMVVARRQFRVQARQTNLALKMTRRANAASLRVSEIAADAAKVSAESQRQALLIEYEPSIEVRNPKIELNRWHEACVAWEVINGGSRPFRLVRMYLGSTISDVRAGKATEIRATMGAGRSIDAIIKTRPLSQEELVRLNDGELFIECTFCFWVKHPISNVDVYRSLVREIRCNRTEIVGLSFSHDEDVWPDWAH
jgi:hypothetical protein